MMLASGPYDGRRLRRKRCDACVKRQIKCEGGFPCQNCTKTNRKCTQTKRKKSAAPVFVHVTRETFTSASELDQVTRAASPSSLISLKRGDIYVAYFFTTYCRQNAFTSLSRYFQTSLALLMHQSPELCDAMSAISALHIDQHEKSSHSAASVSDDHLAALQAYSRSVRCVQTKIASKSFIHDPSALWTTLLLSVFELMRDDTGMNWLAHFLHGTSTILCLQGPSILAVPGIASKDRRSFFFSARIFEIARALIYTEPTFLSAPEWRIAINLYWSRETNHWRSPKEALFDMLPQFVDLAIRTVAFVSHAENMAKQAQDDLASALAQEGLTLQFSLACWETETASSQTSRTSEETLDTEHSIALVYYHTISIYLDGLFSYHTPFTSASAPLSPILDRGKIEWHIAHILIICRRLLSCGCAGVLLFFPLRVAGARARDSSTQSEILRLFQTIRQRGFTVAQSFVQDLNDVWAQR